MDENTGEARATIYRQHRDGNRFRYDFEHTVLHEIGHAVYYNSLSGEDRAEWAKRHFASPMLYNEQSRAAHEHFPHLYAAYILRPEVARQGFSELYSFLRDQVFDGKEY